MIPNPPRITVGAVLAAAGSGHRFGEKKQFRSLHRRPLFYYALRTFLDLSDFSEIVLVVPAEDLDRVRREIRSITSRKSIAVVAGGERRQDSVVRGIQALSETCDLICIHDAARPFVTANQIRNCLKVAVEYDGAIVAVPVRDTLKQVDQANRLIVKTDDRGRYWLAQTPQVFKRRLLLEALERADKKGETVTDEASLVEAIGGKVAVVEGSLLNLKVTTADDMVFTEAAYQNWKEAQA